ncbi:TPA: RNA methyltransferase [Candidatus Woesearchaeota archaeon]|nr:RNA methyltransferase [Candidatus Woesearchaeota archaeon]HII68702.1 RNA methyltransferase [Candidatus Woesearchaeota archaeon]
MITVVLIEPMSPGNIGAIARAMKNFCLTRLLLLNPQCDPKADEALKRAMHAKDILNKARTITKKDLQRFDVVIGTTAKVGTDYNLTRSPILPSQLAQKLNPKAHAAILLGREDTGLTNEELQLCDITITIPSGDSYKALNISHAAAIIFYELYRAQGENGHAQKYPPASAKEKEVMLAYINGILAKLAFSKPTEKATQEKAWKRVLGKSFLTRREAFALMGFFRKVLNKRE